MRKKIISKQINKWGHLDNDKCYEENKTRWEGERVPKGEEGPLGRVAGRCILSLNVHESR